jgi:hypothetical protein
MSFNQLPIELQHHITSYIHPSTMLVNKSFYNLIKPYY